MGLFWAQGPQVALVKRSTSTILSPDIVIIEDKNNEMNSTAKNVHNVFILLRVLFINMGYNMQL
jgi:hypothetical protein